MLISFEDLQRWTGYKQPADVARFLDRHHVPKMVGRGGLPCTTAEAINQALGVRVGAGVVERIEL